MGAASTGWRWSEWVGSGLARSWGSYELAHRRGDLPMIEGESNPTVRHERTDVEAGGVLIFAAGLIVLLAFIAAIVWGLFHSLVRTEPASELPFTAEELSPRPPSP